MDDEDSDVDLNEEDEEDKEVGVAGEEEAENAARFTSVPPGARVDCHVAMRTLKRAMEREVVGVAEWTRDAMEAEGLNVENSLGVNFFFLGDLLGVVQRGIALPFKTETRMALTTDVLFVEFISLVVAGSYGKPVAALHSVDDAFGDQLNEYL